MNKYCRICAGILIGGMLCLTGCQQIQKTAQTNEGSVTTHTPFKIEENDLKLITTPQDSRITVYESTTFGIYESVLADLYHSYSTVESVDDLKKNLQKDMDSINEKVPVMGDFHKLEEYIDESNGIQLYGIDDSNSMMYSAIFNLNGSMQVAYNTEWKTSEKETLDFEKEAKNIREYTTLDVSAADLQVVYNRVLDECYEGGSYSYSVSQDDVYRYIQVSCTNFNAEDETWTISALSSYDPAHS